MSEEGRPAGWAMPGNARKFHYFDQGEIVSVCQRWMFTGPRDPSPPGDKKGKDDCAPCWRRIEMRGAKGTTNEGEFL